MSFLFGENQEMQKRKSKRKKEPRTIAIFEIPKEAIGVHVRFMMSKESTFNIIIMQHVSQDQMMDSIKIEAGQL